MINEKSIYHNNNRNKNASKLENYFVLIHVLRSVFVVTGAGAASLSICVFCVLTVTVTV